MNSNDLKNKGLNAVFWNLSGTLLKQGISFVISLFLARLLTPTDFGIVGMATVFITFTQGFADLGLSSALIQLKEPTQKQYSSVFYFNMFIALILAITLFSSAELIANFYNKQEVKPIVQFISYSFLINALTSVQWAILYKNLDVKKTRLASIISSIIAGIVGVSLAFSGYGVWSVVYSGFVGSIVSVGIIWYRSTWRPSLFFSIKEIKSLFPFGFKVFIINYMQEVYDKVDILIIGKIFQPATLGFYFRASSFNQLITKYTSQSLSGVFFPVISKLQDNKEEIRRVFTKTLQTVCFLSLLLSGILYVNAEPLIILLFTAKWQPAVSLFQILVFSSYVFPMTLIFNGVLLGTGNSGRQLKLEVWKKVLGIIGLLIGFIFGLTGYLWSLAITATLGLFLSVYFIEKTIQIKVVASLGYVYSYALPMLVGILITQFINNLFDFHHVIKLAINTCCFLTSYLGLCFLLKLKGYHYVIKLLQEFVSQRFNTLLQKKYE